MVQYYILYFYDYTEQGPQRWLIAWSKWHQLAWWPNICCGHLSYIINFLVESDGCGESGADLLCNLILLWDIIHHVVNIIDISGEKHRWRSHSACEMKVTQHRGCAIGIILCTCVTMLRGDVILQELASRCKACTELQCQIMRVKTFNIHVPVHKRSATCRDTARVGSWMY